MGALSPSVSTWGTVPLAHAPAASDLGLRGPCSEATRPHDLPLSAEQHREGSPKQEVLRRWGEGGGFGEGSPASMGRSSDHSPPLQAGGRRLI